MSLVVTLFIETAAWIAFNRITPFSTSRMAVAMRSTTVSAVLMTLYLKIYQPPAIDPADLWMFAIVNATLAVLISFVSFTRDMSRAV